MTSSLRLRHSTLKATQCSFKCTGATQNSAIRKSVTVNYMVALSWIQKNCQNRNSSALASCSLITPINRSMMVSKLMPRSTVTLFQASKLRTWPAQSAQIFSTIWRSRPISHSLTGFLAKMKALLSVMTKAGASSQWSSFASLALETKFTTSPLRRARSVSTL